MREALHGIFDRSLDGRAPRRADWEILGRELTIARQHERFVSTGGGFAWRWDDSAALDRMLWPIAQSAAQLLASAGLARVRRCEGEDCGWLFLDASRNRSRHWCDMRDCGNRAKIRRFRAKSARRHS